jgi:hypothetical protein
MVLAGLEVTEGDTWQERGAWAGKWGFAGLGGPIFVLNLKVDIDICRLRFASADSAAE